MRDLDSTDLAGAAYLAREADAYDASLSGCLCRGPRGVVGGVCGRCGREAA